VNHGRRHVAAGGAEQEKQEEQETIFVFPALQIRARDHPLVVFVRHVVGWL
jgi:hypothetical protein